MSAGTQTTLIEVVYLSLSRHILGQYTDYATTASFHQKKNYPC
jgi:hypothetical protein